MPHPQNRINSDFNSRLWAGQLKAAKNDGKKDKEEAGGLNAFDPPKNFSQAKGQNRTMAAASKSGSAAFDAFGKISKITARRLAWWLAAAVGLPNILIFLAIAGVVVLLVVIDNELGLIGKIFVIIEHIIK